MKTEARAFAAILLSAATTIAIVADEAKQPAPRPVRDAAWFKKADKDGDGRLSRQEAPDQKSFDEADTDRDGFATVEELQVFLTNRSQGKLAAKKPAAKSVASKASKLTPAPETYRKKEVTIFSDGTRMAGDLYLPADLKEGEKRPAIVFCAGTGGTKSGTGGRLGPNFAAHGYIALAFDYRGWGASESQLMAVDTQPKPDETGQLTTKVRALRWQMNYTDQTEDIGAAISFLAGEPGVDPERIGILGSSYGGGLVTWMAMRTDIPAHPPAFVQMHTGISTSPRPSMGAWVLYGLGTENANLPGFVTVSAPANNGGSVNFGSAFLPASYQGTKIGTNRQPIARAQIANLKSPRSHSAQEEQLDFVRSLNRSTDPGNSNDPFMTGLAEAHELAYRMQGELPPVIDLSKESEATKTLYGIGTPSTDDFGRQCLMARRLLEAGVRFVEVCHGGWDQHRNLKADHGQHAAATDVPIAGLLRDLAERGLLDDTLVLWGGEFGRTPYAQVDDGRDHNHTGYTTWMAGGGVKGGSRYGSTDEFGYEAVENPMHIHDWHATILHILGLDHERLTFPYAGRDMRLTDVKGRVHEGVLS